MHTEKKLMNIMLPCVLFIVSVCVDLYCGYDEQQSKQENKKKKLSISGMINDVYVCVGC